jgi:hypothetical protein
MNAPSHKPYAQGSTESYMLYTHPSLVVVVDSVWHSVASTCKDTNTKREGHAKRGPETTQSSGLEHVWFGQPVLYLLKLFRIFWYFWPCSEANMLWKAIVRCRNKGNIKKLQENYKRADNTRNKYRQTHIRDSTHPERPPINKSMNNLSEYRNEDNV